MDILAQLKDWLAATFKQPVDEAESPPTTEPAPPVIPTKIVDGLADDDWTIRQEAVNALVRFPFDDTLPHLQTTIRDADASVRLATIKVLATINDTHATRLIAQALHDDEAPLVDAAAALLARRGRAALPAVLDALDSPNVNARGAAAEILYEMAPPEAIPRLMIALADNNTPWMQQERIGDIAARALEKIGTPKALQAVEWWRSLQAQHARKAETRQAHGELFVPDDSPPPDDDAIEPDAEPPSPPVTAPDDAPAAPQPAVIPQAQDPLSTILTQLDSGAWGVREDAAKALQKHIRGLATDTDTQTIRSHLEARLQHDDWAVRFAIVESLTWLDDRAVISQLLPLVEDAHWMVRAAAIRGLAEYEAEEALGMICMALGDANENVREAAAEAIGTLKMEEAITSLQWVIDDGSAHVRYAVVKALQQINSAEGLPLLLKTATDRDVNVRWLSVQTLQTLGNEYCIPILQMSLDDDDHPPWESEPIRVLAAAALRRIGTPEAQEALQQAGIVNDENQEPPL